MKLSISPLAVFLMLFTLLIIPFSGTQSVQAACEPGHIIYVSPSGSGADGCSWATAFTTLQDAFAIATNPDQIWVAAGTYYPDEGAGQTNDSRDSTFILKNGVLVYGGFNGTETELSQRDPDTNVTILDGDIGTVGVTSDNAYHVAAATAIITSVTRLDGFTIQNGNANEMNNFGGGIYVSNTSGNLHLSNLIVTNNLGGNGSGVYAFTSIVTITDLVVDGNTANTHGGGLYLDTCHASITNVTVSNNTALAGFGGGIYTKLGNPTLTNVTISGNTTAQLGGGMYNINGNPVLLDVTFTGNKTLTGSSLGGGMHNTNTNTSLYTVTPPLTNVTFSNNQSVGGGGGGLYNFKSHPTITNATFSGNSADVRGGAMLNEGSNPVLNNVTLTGNTAPATSGSAIRNSYAEGVDVSNPSIKNTILWDNGSEEVVNDVGNGATITDSVVEGGCPALATCTNILSTDPVLGVLADQGGNTDTIPVGSGSSARNAGGVNVSCASTDQRGVTRPQGSACDIGAFEAKLLTVTADSKTKSYGEADPAFTFQYSGFFGGDTESAIDIPPTCSVVGEHTNVGTYPITCSGGADDEYIFAYVDATLTVNKATPTLSVTNSPVLYNELPQSASVSASVAGVVSNVLTGGAATQTNAGTYAVTANFVPTDTTNYNSLVGASAGNFVINKATPTLIVTNSPVLYNGSPQSANVVESASVPGVVSNVLTGGAATQTNAGTYAVTADFVPTDTTNYHSLTGASAGNFVINKATPTLIVTNSPVLYNGSPQSANVVESASVAGVVSNVLTGGAATQTNAGTYAVTANFVPTDTTNYNSLTGASAGNFIINKVTPTLSVTNSPVLYNGSPQSASVSASVAGVVSNVLTGGAASQINAGTYAVTANFVPTDTTNYNSLAGASAGNFIINKVTPTLSVTNSPVLHDGFSHSALVSASVPGVVSNVLTGGASSQTNIGTYAVTANFVPTDTTNYNSLTGASAGNFVIAYELIPPTVLSIVRSDVNPTGANSVNFTVTFSEDVLSVSASDFVLTTTGVSNASISGVSGTGSVRTVQVNTGTGDGTIRLDLIDEDTITDIYTNRLGGTGLGNGNFTSGESYIIAKIIPALIVPVNDDAVLSNRPLFDWSDIPGATQYGLQVSKNPTFTQVVLNVTIKTGSAYTPTRDLPKNMLLYWRVRGKTGTTWSLYSEVRSFTSANPPSTPVLNLPANNALNKDYIPLFKWKAVPSLPVGTTFQHYQLQVDDNADFSSPVINDTSITDRLTVQFQTVTPLPHNTKFYWRVRAVNNDDEVSNWSAVRIIRTVVDAPVLVSPNDGFISLTPRPFFDWDVPSGSATIKNYTIQIAKDNQFKQIVHTGNPTSSSYSPTADLPKNLLLYWRVQTKGANGPSLWSEVRSFESANSPSTPVLSAPANNALNKDYIPLFKWKAVTLPAGTDFLHYQLQVDDNADFSSPELDDTSITAVATVEFQTTNPFTPNTKFYWRVRAVNDDNEVSNWSVVRYFRTIIPTPTLLSPADASAVGTLKPTFDWTDASGTITGYTIQISTSSTFSSTLVNATTVSSTYTPANNLPAGKTLYWRVRVNGANGPSTWVSPPFSFTTP